MFTCKFGPPISGLLAVETITLPLLYLATEMANRENATDNAVLSALIFMEIGAIVVMILQVKEFCIGTSAIPLSFLGVFLLNFIVSTFFVFGKFQIGNQIQLFSQIFFTIPYFLNDHGDVNPCFAWACPFLPILMALNFSAYINTSKWFISKFSTCLTNPW